MTLLALTLVPAGGASAATDRSSAVATVDFTLGESHVTTDYVFSDPIFGSFTMGVATRAISIETRTPSRGLPVTCHLGEDVAGGIIFSATEWDSGRVVMDVQGATLLGEGAALTCEDDPTVDGWSVVWILDVSQTSAPVLSLPWNELFLTLEHTTTSYSTVTTVPRTVRAGDTIRVIGEPGTWSATEPSGWIAPSSGFSSFDLHPTLSTDGSTLTGKIPAAIDPALAGAAVLSASTYRPGLPIVVPSRSTTWEASVDLVVLDVPERAETTTETEIDWPVTFSFRRELAEVWVSSARNVSITGTVTLYVDGEQVGPPASVAPNRDYVSFTLPRLSRGPHQITSQYSGNDELLPSTSRPEPVRVLF